jgi:hypothetical protein
MQSVTRVKKSCYLGVDIRKVGYGQPLLLVLHRIIEQEFIPIGMAATEG